MAKVLHAADFHLDSAFRSLPEEQARLRRQESRELPGRLVDWANDHGAQLMLLAGDLFDSFLAFRALDGFVDDAGGLLLRAGDLLFGHALAIANTEEEKQHCRRSKGGRCYDPTGRCHGWCSSYS